MRIFYALTFEEESKDIICLHRDTLANHALKGSFTRKENFHLTLEFIGDVKVSELKDYETILDQLSSDPLDLYINHVGTFPKKNRAVLWLGLDKNDDLTRLQKNLRKLLKVYELKHEDRKYHPHITLGRQVLLDIQTDDIIIPASKLKLHSLALMHSHRIKDVLTYEPIYEVEF